MRGDNYNIMSSQVSFDSTYMYACIVFLLFILQGEKKPSVKGLKKELLPVEAFCCCIRSLYCNFPECLGCQGEHECLCVECSYKRCTAGGHESALVAADTTDDDLICTCCASGCYLVRITTCCKCVNQYFCIEDRCSFPCDDDVPCMLAYFCIVCYYKGLYQFFCCRTFGQIDPELSPFIQNQGQIVDVRTIYDTHSVPNPLSSVPNSINLT